MDESDGIPPFQSVRVFEAAARTGSFARAAEELGVSAGAVSQHIRILEEFAGQPLFRRLGRGVELTEAGQSAYQHAGAAMAEMLQAGRAMRAKLRGQRVAISAAPSFASKWLAPRLNRFQDAHPGFDVRLFADAQLVEFAGSDIDFAVRYGPGGYEGLHYERLMPESVVVLCSPRLLNGGGAVAASDLLALPLIHEDGPERDPSCPTWSVWFASRGLKREDAERGLRFNQSALAIEAAVAGKGLVLAKRQLATRDIESGKLVAPLADAGAPLGFAYWLVWPRGRRFEAAQTAFLDWLRSETGAADAQLGEGI